MNLKSEFVILHHKNDNNVQFGFSINYEGENEISYKQH